MARRSASLGRSVLDLDVDDSKFHSKLANARVAAQNWTEQTGTTLSKAGKALSGVGESWTRNITLPILAAGGATAKLALDFDKSLTQIVSLTDVTQDEIGGVREEILKLAPAIGKSPQELAEAFYFLASAGFDAKESMDVLTIAAKASAAGLGETQTVAKTIGAVVNAYGKENITAARATDILVAAIADGTAEAPEFAASIGQVVGSAAQIGAKFEDVAAAVSAMTLTGLDAAEATTSLNQVFVTLFKPTTQAKKALDGYGLSAAGLRQEIKEKGLLPVLQELAQKFDGDAEATAAVFGNVRALRGILALTGPAAAKTAHVFDDVAKSTGRLDEAVANYLASPNAKFNQALAQLEADGIRLGEDVLPMVVEVLDQLADGASSLADWWDTLDDGTKHLIIQALALTAAVGPVLIVVGKLTSGAGALFKAISFLTGAKGFPALISNLKAGKIGLLGWVGLFVAASEGLKAASAPLDDWINGLIHGQQAVKDFHDLVALTGSEMGANLIGNKLHDWGISLQTFSKIMEVTGTTAQEAFQLLIDASGDAQHIIDVHTGALIADGERAIHAMGLVKQEAIANAQTLPPAVGDALAGGKGSVATGADTAAGAIPHSFKDAMQEATDLAAQLPDDIAAAIIGGTKGELKDLRKTLRDILVNSVSDAVAGAKLAALLFGPGVAEGLAGGKGKKSTEEIARTIDEVLEPGLESLLTLYPKAFEGGKDVPKGIKAGIEQLGPQAIQAYKDMIGKQDLTLAQLKQIAKDRGDEAMAAYIQSIIDKKRAAKDAAGDVADAAGGALDFSNAASAAGRAVINAYMDAMEATIGTRVTGFENKVGTLLNIISGTNSPPYTAFIKAGTGAGAHYMDALGGSLKAGMRDLGRLVSGDLLAMPAIRTPTATLAGAAHPYNDLAGGVLTDRAARTEPVRGGNTYQVTTGSVPREKSTLEILAEMRRAEYLGQLPGSKS